MDASVYECSNSLYHLHWFCVTKKEATDLCVVHSLEPLNAITIQHSGVTSFTDEITKQFASHACSGMLDLYIGYNECMLAESSCDYTMFQSPYGALRLTKLPMGWTNAVLVFHDNVTHILQPEVPQSTILYIDNVPVRGPTTMYQRQNGTFETIPENNGICHFVWEHFQNLNQIVQCMKYCGGTFLGKKSLLCAHEITVVGHVCTPKGCIPDPTRVNKIVNWGPCADLSEVCAFLGTVGVVHVFIKNFAHITHPFMSLTQKDALFVFGPEQISAQEALKATLLASPALRPIDYTSTAPIILGVDTSHVVVSYLLCQCDVDNPRLCCYAHFGSITLNNCKSHFSQPKLKLYGLFHALCSLKFYLIGVQNLIVEVDARYIKGMLSNPDLAPSASINRWIVSILLFHFTLIHIPSTQHGPDGLSHCPRQPTNGNLDPVDNPDFNDWVNQVYKFMHFLNPLQWPVSHPNLCTTFTSDAVDDDGTLRDPAATTPLTYDSFP